MANITWKVSRGSGGSDELLNGVVGLRKWRAALASMKAGVTPKINLNIIGDSITEGMGTTDFRTKSYTNLVRIALAAKYGDVGNGLIPSWHPDSNIAGTPWWTYAGTGWTNEATFGLTMLCKRSQTSGDTATISFNGTGIKFLFLRGSACGTCTIAIDGGAPTSYNFANGTTEYANVTTISGLANGAHTAVITSTVAAGKYIWLIGAYEIKGTTGVQVNMCGRYGTQTASSYPDPSLQVSINHFQPKLTLVALLSNDFAGSIPVDNYKARLQAIVTRALTTGDVMLMSLGHRNATSTYPQKDYADMMRTVADENNIAYLDLFNRWGGGLGATAGITAKNLGLMDDVHPTDAGAQDIAAAILKVIDE